MSKTTINRHAKIISITGLTVILIATLFPFRFIFNTNLPSEWLNQVTYGLFNQSGWKELVGNILLFVPFGFGVAGLANHNQKSLFSSFSTTFAAGLALSLLVEVMQLFMSMRTSDVSDLFVNSLGTTCGYLLFYFYSRPLLQLTTLIEQQIFQKLSWTKIMILSVAYLLGIGILWQSWHKNIALQNWDMTFPLLIGNENSGNRPWNGTVSKLYFSDFVLTGEEIEHAFNQGEPSSELLLALYQLDAENDSFPDQLGYLPDLSRDEDKLQVQFLKSVSTTNLLNERLKATSQFTVGAIVQTAVTHQTGPARIISISATPLERNFMLGQEGDDLIIRLRTPATDKNGNQPEFIIPNLFADRQPHHLIITYDGNIIQIYHDNIQQMIRFDLMEITVAYQFFSIFYNAPVILPVNQTGYLLFKYGLFTGFPFILVWIHALNLMRRQKLIKL